MAGLRRAQTPPGTTPVTAGYNTGIRPRPARPPPTPGHPPPPTPPMKQALDQHPRGEDAPRGQRGPGGPRDGCEERRALLLVPRAVVPADRVVMGDRATGADDRLADRVLDLVPDANLGTAPAGRDDSEVRRRPVRVHVGEPAGDHRDLRRSRGLDGGDDGRVQCRESGPGTGRLDRLDDQPAPPEGRAPRRRA